MAAVPFLSPTTSDEASEASRVSRRNNSQRRDSARESLVEEALKRVAVCASLGRRLRLALLGEAESDKKECGDLLPSGSLTAQSSSAAPPANTTDCLSQCCAEAASAQAAAQGWSSFCCCAFPSIGAPQICRATVDRLHSMRAFTHQLAGVRWLWSALHSPASLAGCALADEPGLGSSAQCLVFLSISYETGLSRAPSLIVLPDEECGARTAPEEGEPRGDTGNDAVDARSDGGVSHVRRWLRLCSHWAPRLRALPLLSLAELPAETASAPERRSGASSSFTAMPSLATLRRDAGREEAADAEGSGGTNGEAVLSGEGIAPAHIYVTTFSALQRRNGELLRLLRKEHEALSFLVADARSLCSCGQTSPAPEEGKTKNEGGKKELRSRRLCVSAFDSEASVLYGLAASVNELWRGATKPQLVVVTNEFDANSYASLRLLLPLFLPQVFESPAEVDKLAEALAAEDSPNKATAAAFARRCIFPAVLRRLRRDVLIPFQPQPLRRRESVELTALQRQVYSEAEARGVEGLLRAATAEPPATNTSSSSGRGNRNSAGAAGAEEDEAQSVAARVVESMRLVSVHPALVLTCAESVSLAASSKPACMQGAAASDDEPSTTSCGGPVDGPLMEALVDALQLTLPHAPVSGKRGCLCWQTTRDASCSETAETKCAVCEERRRSVMEAVREWTCWYALHTARLLGVETPQSIQRRLLRDSGKLQWLCAFLSGIRMPFAAPSEESPAGLEARPPLLSEAAAQGAAVASEFLEAFSRKWIPSGGDGGAGREGGETAKEGSSRLDVKIASLRNAFAKAVVVNVLLEGETAGRRGSVGLMMRDALFPRPLVIGPLTTEAEAACILKDFLRAKASQCQVLVVECLRVFFRIPPHLLATIWHLVWLSPPEAETPPPGQAQKAEGAASLSQSVEEHFFSVGRQYPFNVVSLVARRSIEDTEED